MCVSFADVTELSWWNSDVCGHMKKNSRELKEGDGRATWEERREELMMSFHMLFKNEPNDVFGVQNRPTWPRYNFLKEPH